ncbi:MAG: OsmC family protein [Chloroflexi bacterium]|nr:OsmC family protein [Chloroflexota bacterium]
MADREVRTVASGNAFRVDLASARHTWTLDEPLDEGGADTGPSPVTAFLGALASCLTMSFQFQARRKGIPIDRIEGWIASNEERHIEQIAVELQVWSSASEEAVAALLPAAKRGCYVSGVIRPDIKYTVELAVYPSAGNT